jgi:AbrB family looped-hinge helix DNA binding protein
MSSVTVSPKYQVVIPKQVREALKIQPGQKLRVVAADGVIRLFPDRPIEQLRGFAKGIPLFEREPDRTL